MLLVVLFLNEIKSGSKIRHSLFSAVIYIDYASDSNPCSLSLLNERILRDHLLPYKSYL